LLADVHSRADAPFQAATISEIDREGGNQAQGLTTRRMGKGDLRRVEPEPPDG
jgi:hypothetical protein